MKRRRKPPAKPTPAETAARRFPPPLNEGQRLLQLAVLSASFATVARNIGVSKASTIEWLKGVKRPRPEPRAKIFAAYGIPPDAWVHLPSSGVTARVPVNGHAPLAAPVTPAPAVTSSSTASATSGTAPSSLDDCLAVLDGVRTQRNRPDLMATERVKLADTEVRLLTLRSRLERDAELRDDRMVREHPEWHRLRRTILAALAKHPTALRDVVDAVGEQMRVDAENKGA